MGTRARIVVHAEGDPTAVAAAAFDEMARIEAVLSDYDPASEAMQIAAKPVGRWHAVSPTLLDVLLKSRDLWRLSDGAFDPTLGPLTQLWRESRRAGRLPDRQALSAVLAASGFQHVEIDADRSAVRLARSGMRLDFGGIGKGYAAGAAIAVLREAGFASAMVDLGGDLALGDPPPSRTGWRVEIETGLGAASIERLANVGVATSGDLEQFIELGGVRYSHIIDPRTGLGLTRRVAVTVVAPQAWLADAAASAVSVDPRHARTIEDVFPGTRIRLIEGD